MQWQPSLSTRLAGLPNVLAGPLLRKVTEETVTVWFALKRKATVTLTVYDDKGVRIFSGQRDTIAVGSNLHIVAVTAKAAPSDFSLNSTQIYLYDATFTYPAMGTLAAATEASIALATRNARLTYAPYGRPSFCLPSTDINTLRILHGSCRKAAGDGPDVLALVDSLIADKATIIGERPQQLLLTGDQIYADDVAASLLVMLTDAATVLLGFDEIMQPGVTASMLPPFSRRKILDSAGFSSEDLDSHLMSLGEYLCMYLFVWSDVLWPTNDADIPSVDTVLAVSAAFVPEPVMNPGDDNISPDMRAWVHARDVIGPDLRNLLTMRASILNVRCALANIPSYMIFDDHEVTDDWNMTLDRAKALYGQPLGRQVVRNALVAYAVCQHWGNVPEQFLETQTELPGTSLLIMLNGQDGVRYISNAASISAIVSVHTADEVAAHGGSFHGFGSLTYNYTIEGSAHQVIVTDSRTFRAFPRGGGEAPDLLPPDQFVAQIVNTPPLKRTEDIQRRALIVVLSTNAPPIPSIRSATDHDNISNFFKHFPDIHEAWDLPSVALDRLAKALSDKMGFDPAQSEKVVVLSGDVHMGFAARLHYRATKRFEASDTQHANLVIAQLVASSFKKQTDDTIAIQREGYTYAPTGTHFLIPPHLTEYYAGWAVTPAGQKMGKWDGDTIKLSAVASTQLRRAKHRSKKRVPPPLNEITTPPDYGYQLDYLSMTNGGAAPAGLLPLPPLPSGGATEDERKEAAHVHKLATANFRKYNLDPKTIRHIIGVNNFGDLTFARPVAPATGPFMVKHRLRFRDTAGASLFVDYDINMEAVDPTHPTDPVFRQVTP